MPPANLLVGSTCGSIYIVRCDPIAKTVSLKTTIKAGHQPISLLVDIPNKSFYCLDRNLDDPEGSLLTLSPGEFGSIDEKLSIHTGASRPNHMSAIGNMIYINHESGYSFVKIPAAPKSTRRRRASNLTPVAENTVAESLDELYAISKTMDDAGEPAVQGLDAIENIQKHLDAESALDTTELKGIVPTKVPILKFANIQKPENWCLGLSKEGVSTYKIESEGTLIHQTMLDLGEKCVDLDTSGSTCYVLTTSQIVTCEVSATGQITRSGTGHKLSSNSEMFGMTRCIKVAKAANVAVVLTTNSVILVDLRAPRSRTMSIEADYVSLSTDQQLFFLCDQGGDCISMYTIHGVFLGKCSIKEPAEAIQMS